MQKKKVTIKFNKDASIEVVSKDPDVAVFLQYPDDSEVEVLEGEIKAYGHKDDDKGFGGRLGGLS